MKRIMHRIVLTLGLVAAVTSNTQPVLAEVNLGLPLPGLVISEVQTGGLTSSSTEDGHQEFIELYNPHDIPYDMEGTRLEYLSALHTGAGSPTRVLAALSGVVPPKGFVVISYPAYLTDADFFMLPVSSSSSGLLARTGGHVRLMNNTDSVIDLVSWGSATGIGSWWKSIEIPPSNSIQRSLPGDRDYTTGLTYRSPTAEVTPGVAGLPSLPEVPDDPEPEPPTPEVPLDCQDLELSEILPNAAGTDDGKEFIEIHNPTKEAVALQGCQLQLGTDKVYLLPDEVLPGGTYKAFYDSQTGLTLPNAVAQVVQLVSTDGNKGATYANNMKDDVSWALIDGTWQPTMLPTPNAANKLGTADDNLPEGSPQTCAPGKERNPETNRCRTAPVTTNTACKTGQERSPTTNRCRSVLAVSTALAPCGPNQERNPDTNRCRAVQAASAAPKPCPEGQERNPLTNRCRRVTADAANHLATVKDIPGSTLANNYRWWIAASILLGALVYGVYEWRHDLVNRIHRFKARWPQK